MNTKSKIPNFFKYSQTTVDTSRSGFKYDQTIKGSCMLGRLIPIGAPIPVLPGDTFSLNLQGLFRSGTLIAPILDDMYIDVMACWVPDRIVWNNYLQWLGENETSAWTQTVDREIPNIDLDFLAGEIDEGNIGTYMTLNTGSLLSYSSDGGLSTFFGNTMLFDKFGLLVGLLGACTNYLAEDSLTEAQAKLFKISVLEARAYYSVWNNIWRDANWQRPVLFSKGDTGNSGELGYWLGDTEKGFKRTVEGVSTYDLELESGDSTGTEIPYIFAPLMPACKFHDAANSILPQPQSGAATQLLANTTAPVGFKASVTETITAGASLGYASGSSFTEGVFAQAKTQGGLSSTNYQSPVYADLSQVDITINDFRKLVLMQEYKELLARGGQHAEDIINTFFGVSDSKVLVTKPEILSHQRVVVGINQIVATADSTNGSQTTHLGETGGYSITGLNLHLCNKTFTEHGHIVLVFTIRQLESYSQEIPEQFRRISKFDRFWRIFDHIGEEGVKYSCFNGFSFYPEAFIGYQEAWYSYRTQRNIVTGALNPAVYGSLNYWVLSNVFDAAMGIGPDFFCATPVNLDRALIVDHTQAPQFVYDLRVIGQAYRGMSAHSYPLMFGRY